MSRDWTPEELAAASKAMKAAGHMSYEEFCAELDRIDHNERPSLAALRELQRRLCGAGE